VDGKLNVTTWKDAISHTFAANDLKVVPNAWQNIVVVWNGIIVEIFKNGSLVDGYSYNDGMDINGRYLYIGQRENNTNPILVQLVM
jgi:hypothetical protein